MLNYPRAVIFHEVVKEGATVNQNVELQTTHDVTSHCWYA